MRLVISQLRHVRCTASHVRLSGEIATIRQPIVTNSTAERAGGAYC